MRLETRKEGVLWAIDGLGVAAPLSDRPTVRPADLLQTNVSRTAVMPIQLDPPAQTPCLRIAGVELGGLPHATRQANSEPAYSIRPREGARVVA